MNELPLVEVLLVVFLISMASFWIIGYEKSIQIKTFEDYFRLENNTKRSKDAIWSLVAGNITLATGMMYVASLAQSRGWIVALFAPIGGIIGYIIISKFIVYIPQQYDSLLDALKDEAKVLYKTISFFTIFVFLVIIALEVYLSSQLLSMLFVFQEKGIEGDLTQKDLAIIFSVVIYICTLVYVFFGGIKGVVFTDKIQLGIFIAMLGILLYANIHSKSDASALLQFFKHESQINYFNFPTLLLVFLIAVTTQFYNILNTSVGASFDHKRQKYIFKWAGTWIVLINIVFIIIGILSMQFANPKYLGIDEIVHLLLSDGYYGLLFIIIIQLGMLSILIATVDSAMIAISNYLYSNIFSKKYDEEVSNKIKVYFILFPNLSITAFLIFLFYTDISIADYLFTILLPLSMLSIVMMNIMNP